MNTSKRRYLSFLTVLSVTLLSYQNCSQQYDLQLDQSSLLKNSIPADDPASELQSSTLLVGHSDTAPLKLFFIVDNSNSMAVNNYNLQKSISSMFDPNSEQSLSQFDTDIFFITTAQLSKLNGALNEGNLFTSEKYIKFHMLNSSNLTTILQNDRTEDFISGLIAGDAAGFQILSPEPLASLNPSAKIQRILPASVTEFQMQNDGSIKALASISYKKGDDLLELKNKVSNRLSIILPHKTQNAKIAHLGELLDKESGMCAMARILRNPSQYIKNGDLASFIIVSDENEFDITGSKCIQSTSIENRINAQCIKNHPDRMIKQKTISYLLPPGEDKIKFGAGLTPKDILKNKKETTFKLTPKNSYCEVYAQSSYKISYAYKIPQYKISFEQADLISTREGDTKIYSSYKNLTTSNIKGTLPEICDEGLLRSKASILSTSLIKNINCIESEASILANQNMYSPVDKHQDIDLNASSSCSDSVKSILNDKIPHAGTTIESCTIIKNEEKIASANSISGNSFFNRTACENYSSDLCLKSNNSKIGCRITSFYEAQQTQSLDPYIITTNYGLDCNSSCSSTHDFCRTDLKTGTIKNFASVTGYNCSSSSVASSETFLEPQSKQNKDIFIKQASYDSYTSIDPSIAGVCDLTCAQTGMCSSSSEKLKDFYKECLQTKKEFIVGMQSVISSLAIFEDADDSFNCSSKCSDKIGLCGANSSNTTTVEQHITSYLKGSNCTSKSDPLTIPAYKEIKYLNEVLNADLIKECSGDFILDSSSIQVTGIQNKSEDPVIEPLSGNSNPQMPEYIKYKLNQLFGNERASLTSFVTLDESNLQPTTSVGSAYIKLTQDLKGSSYPINTNDSKGYSQALENLSGILNNLLHRSFKVPNMSEKQSIQRVHLRDAKSGQFYELKKEAWTATGNTITINESIKLFLEDEIRIEFR